MTFVESILSQLGTLRKPQVAFLVAMFAAFAAFRGHATRTNLHRYGAPDPRTQYRWAKRPFDFRAFNLQALKQAGCLEHDLALVMDASFAAKAGKQTYGLGWFYNGCASRAERGLEISTMGLVDLEEHTAYALEVRQTPPSSSTGSRLDFARRQFREVCPHVPEHVDVILADGDYAKKPFVDDVVAEHFTLVSKLRRDAAMRYLYDGPRRPGPGRPRKYDGKVLFTDIDLHHWGAVGEAEDGSALHTAVLWHDSLKRALRVVRVSQVVQGKLRYVLLFSTDPQMDPWRVYSLYKARFQIEFLFRDGKQFTGLTDGQMRDQQGLDFHFNLSLAALNVLRIEERQRQQAGPGAVISIDSIKRRKLNENLMNRIFSLLDIDPHNPKIQPHLEDLRNYGVIAA